MSEEETSLSPSSPPLCSVPKLDFAEWDVGRVGTLFLSGAFLLIYSVFVLNMLVDMHRSCRLPAYMKTFVAALIMNLWLRILLRIIQTISTRDSTYARLSVYMYCSASLQILFYMQHLLFASVLICLFLEIISVQFRQLVTGSSFLVPFGLIFPLFVFIVFMCLYFYAKPADFLCVIRELFGGITVLCENVLAFYITRYSKRPSSRQATFLVSMQRGYRHAVRGCRYMKKHLKLVTIFYFPTTALESFQYFYAFDECRDELFQLAAAFGDLLLCLYAAMVLVNASHYVGGRLHRIISKILPSSRMGSSPSTEPLHFQGIDATEEHFRQLASLWATAASAGRTLRFTQLYSAH